MLRQTPLYNTHLEMGGKMVPFAGWQMPLRYTNQIEEHLKTRQGAGLFDVGHMSLLKISGNGALDFLQKVSTNNVEKLPVGKVQYSLLLNPTGGVIDDILVYRLKDHYLVVSNASNAEKVWGWFTQNKVKQLEIEDLKKKFTIISLQGPLAERILQPLVAPFNLASLKAYWITQVNINGQELLISRTGYTGEDGFELYLPNIAAVSLWSAILESSSKDILPCGLAARDTLRLEAALPLYSQEYDDNITPLEAGYGWAVDFDKDFIGRTTLLKQKKAGPTKQLVGIAPRDRMIPRSTYRIMPQGSFEIVGMVTSGTLSPTLNKPIGLAYIRRETIEQKIPLAVEIREQFYPIDIVPIPFYKRKRR